MKHLIDRWANVRWGLLATAWLLLLTAVTCTLVPGPGAEESLGETWLIHWHREGGIAGFCDDVTIYVSGPAIVSSCRSEPSRLVGQPQLTAEELATLEQWQGTFQSWTFEQSDPAVADAMTVTIEFVGFGEKALDEATLQQMDRLAQQLVRRVGE